MKLFSNLMEGVVPTGAIGVLMLKSNIAMHKGMLAMHQNRIVFDSGLKMIQNSTPAPDDAVSIQVQTPLSAWTFGDFLISSQNAKLL